MYYFQKSEIYIHKYTHQEASVKPFWAQARKLVPLQVPLHSDCHSHPHTLGQSSALLSSYQISTTGKECVT